MKVIAISQKGHEFLYSARSAHKVSERSAKTICDICNQMKYQLKEDQTWFIHDVDHYDDAYMYGLLQEFRIRKGIVSEYGV